VVSNDQPEALGEVVRQLLAGRAAINIVLGQISKIRFPKTDLAPEVCGLGSVTATSACSQARIFSLLPRAGRSAKRSSALPPQRPAEVERPAGLGLVRYQRSPRLTKCGTVGFVDTRVDWTEVINFNKGVC
jgi:hypothetical protein